MSHAHKDEFERIKREYETVVSLLAAVAKKSQKAATGRHTQFVGLPIVDADLLQSAAATANDAYALLLMARSEGFMRAYIHSQNIPVGAEPKLSVLIDKCRKEFNKTNPKIPIRAGIAEEVHDLREQRNAYAHGYGSKVFPPVARMVTILGRFFDQLP